MAGRGPAPKQNSSRVRDHERRHAPQTKVADDGVPIGPELPDEIEWHPRTVAWWETWRRSAQAKLFLDTDWSFLLDTALMHHAMWSKQQWTLAAEVRLRAAKFGATPEDRARLKLEVLPSASTAQPRKKATSDPRARLKLVDGSAS